MNAANMTCLEIFQQRHCIDILITIHDNGELGFNSIQEDLKINTATLQRRLEDLQQKEFVIKTTCNKDMRSFKYSLSDRGMEASRQLLGFKEFLTKTTPTTQKTP